MIILPPAANKEDSSVDHSVEGDDDEEEIDQDLQLEFNLNHLTSDFNVDSMDCIVLLDQLLVFLHKLTESVRPLTRDGSVVLLLFAL